MIRRALGGARIARAARPSVEWGDGITLDGDLELRGFGTVVLGDGVHVDVVTGLPTRLITQRPDARITVGPGVYLNGATINCSSLVTIGARTLVGPVEIVDADFHAVQADHRRSGQAGLVAPVSIGADCWLAAGALILKGVTIGDGSVVGAGAVVREDVPAGSVVVGNPATVVAQRPHRPV